MPDAGRVAPIRGSVGCFEHPDCKGKGAGKGGAQVRAKRLSFNKKRVKALSFKKIAYICTFKGVPLGVIVPMRDLTDWKNNK